MKRFILALTVLCASGCAPVGPQYEDGHKERKEYFFPVRQLPPQPVYNRLRYVHLPDVKPAIHESGSGAGDSRVPVILPVFRFTMKNAPLSEIAQVLAATSRYSSYCASSIADRKLTIDSLGNLDELANQIAERAGISVVIDHDLREVRFLAAGGPAPELTK